MPKTMAWTLFIVLVAGSLLHKKTMQRTTHKNVYKQRGWFIPKNIFANDV
jgi:hypothetical protein